MTWILTICTVGWGGLCGMYHQHDYPTEAQCYSALNAIYEHQPVSEFRFITCSPKKEKGK